MNSNLRPPTKVRNVQRFCVSDVQYATELAFSDALNSLRWSKAKAARELGVSLNTVRNWCDGKTTPDVCVLMTCPELMHEWQSAFEVRHSEVLAQKAA